MTPRPHVCLALQVLSYITVSTFRYARPGLVELVTSWAEGRLSH